ncbi:type IV pilin N-terminal domain-containing protein [Methanolacinia paynteri]|uniref:type IV pilin N-terminal domain-containing protein n=1 Tax=Methanolacinia paynteri TaxID=230356 RepID=UPI000693D0B7|nr:type IV pilin N-terminal domain-containing protein [Methanolacinia paynteri]
MEFSEINETAVSPVVGVMLMLVVTIIIAAVVSGFAGGFSSSDDSTPNAVISGAYSLSTDVLTITHEGGDQLSTQKITIKLQQNDDDFGGYQSLFSQLGTTGAGLNMLNKSEITNVEGTVWQNPITGQYTVPVFRPGETMFYPAGISGPLGSDAVGKSLILEVDSTDGKLISKSKVMIDT